MSLNIKKNIANNIPLAIVTMIYVILIGVSWDAPYFWDNIQQTSKEAHWFYVNGFSDMFLPGFGEHPEIVSTGYHPPLMGIVTALLWLLLGKNLWVSHLLVGTIALLLIIQTFLLFKQMLPEKLYRWPAMILLLEPTLLAQIYMASPDVILLTTFVVAVRSVLNQNKFLLMMILPVLMLINGRGMLIGGTLFIFSVLYSRCIVKNQLSIRFWINEIFPFIPAAILLSTYFGIYLYTNGWFLSHPDSPWTEGWKAHNNVAGIVKNFFAYGLRLVENGRFVIWGLVPFLIVRMWKKKQLKKLFGDINILLAVLISLMFFLFLYFALSTKIVMGSRYYMPMFFTITLLVFRWVHLLWQDSGVKILTLTTVLFFISGNFWMYPEKIATQWDSTLAHIPFYKLKAQSIDFLRQEEVDFAEVSGGFGINGHQKYADLSESDLYISNDTNNRYYIYSNISNASDDMIDEFNNKEKWKKLKSFKKAGVFVSVLKNIKND